MSNRGSTTAGKTYWLSVGVVLFDTSWLEGAVSEGGSQGFRQLHGDGGQMLTRE